MANPVGRPRAISSPERMDELIDGYIKMCREAIPPEPLTLTGMILALGLTSRAGFDEYETYSEEFSNSVKRAKMYIENAYEIRLVTGTNAASPIFALKNFGWKDKQDVDANLNHSGGVQFSWLKE
jgi:DNA-packaging protein gp3